MKESNILVINAAIKQHQKEFLLNTKGQYMKELDSNVGIEINNILLGQILQRIKEIFIYDCPAWKWVEIRIKAKLNLKFELKVCVELGNTITVLILEISNLTPGLTICVYLQIMDELLVSACLVPSFLPIFGTGRSNNGSYMQSLFFWLRLHFLLSSYGARPNINLDSVRRANFLSLQGKAGQRHKLLIL